MGWPKKLLGAQPARHYLKAIRCVLFLIMDERVQEKNGVRDRIAAEREMYEQSGIFFRFYLQNSSEKKKLRQNMEDMNFFRVCHLFFF